MSSDKPENGSISIMALESGIKYQSLDDAPDEPIVHRVIDKWYNKTEEEWYFRTKGDNNDGSLSYEKEIPDIVSGFQEAVVEVLSYKVIRAAMEKKCRHLALVGGVAANSRLREKVQQDADKQQLKTHIPPLPLCGDNAAMIAALGYHYLKDGKVSKLSDDVYSRVKFRD